MLQVKQETLKASNPGYTYKGTNTYKGNTYKGTATVFSYYFHLRCMGFIAKRPIPLHFKSLIYSLTPYSIRVVDFFKRI